VSPNASQPAQVHHLGAACDGRRICVRGTELNLPHHSVIVCRQICLFRRQSMKQARRRNRRKTVIIHHPEPSIANTLDHCNISGAFLRHCRVVLRSPAVSLCFAFANIYCTLEMTDLADISLISLKHRRTHTTPAYPRDPDHERTLRDSTFCRATEWHQSLRFR
jgi:hypothetical protein